MDLKVKCIELIASVARNDNNSDRPEFQEIFGAVGIKHPTVLL